MTKAVEVTKFAECFLREKGVRNPEVVKLFSTVAKSLATLPHEKAVDGADEVLASLTNILITQRAAAKKDVPRFLSYVTAPAEATPEAEEAPAAAQQQSQPKPN